MLYMSYIFTHFTNLTCSIFCLSKNATKIMSEKNVRTNVKMSLVQKSEHRERREGGEKIKKKKNKKFLQNMYL